MFLCSIFFFILLKVKEMLFLLLWFVGYVLFCCFDKEVEYLLDIFLSNKLNIVCVDDFFLWFWCNFDLFGVYFFWVFLNILGFFDCWLLFDIWFVMRCFLFDFFLVKLRRILKLILVVKCFFWENFSIKKLVFWCFFFVFCWFVF